MSIHVALHHRTTYTYDRLVNLSPHIVRLRPAPHSRTPILSYSMRVSPAEHFLNWQQDGFSNYLGRLVFPEKTDHFSVDIDLVAEMTIINPFDFFLEPEVETFPFGYDKQTRKELAPYLERDEVGPKFKEFLSSIDQNKETPTIQFLVELNQRLQEHIRYLIRMEPNVQSCEETLTLCSGSCRDSAWLLVNLFRHLGLAARFVSGYLIQLAPDVKSLDGPSGPEADFTDLHAWTEVYIPGAGWVGMDPTSGLFAGEGHIPLACSPQPQSAAPITGALDDCKVEFGHTMTVTRLHEAPRSTRPYPEEVWQSIVSLGEEVDARLNDSGIHLTMGGEPTFISIDDMEGAQWNTEAVGHEKRKLSENLIKALRQRWAPGGFLHYGQGKWYPGESLPRWALGCYWRKDGQPTWHDDTLVADVDRDYGFGQEEAKTFVQALTDNLGVSRRFIREAYEDPFYYLHKEQQLPVNVDPKDPKLKDPEERARIARTFNRGLDVAAGYILPLQYGSWKSGPWPFRGDKLYLLPGDSPAGLRLPIESLPWVSAEDIPYDYPVDPMSERTDLPDAETLRSRVHSRQYETEDLQTVRHQPQPFDDPKPVIGESAAWVVRTALCVQPRDGKLYIFMPPINVLEGYLELVSTIEKTAAQTSMPVVLEGYAPPNDYRLQNLKVTPDPGVIEVNIQPMDNWQELVEYTTSLYETARETRLGTEKFMIDGRQTGTGGGNHIVMGGSQPDRSPFLLRPDLLRSFVTYWNNHPSLSYLFSGLFIGPTSQQPRIDEARHDSLYELEIAFAEMDRQFAIYGACPPWMVDRLFRNLLVDVTGNTHRAEFCIDKLYSPDSSSGRLGLLEFRGFEMPPHSRMSLAQQLLLRIFLVWFWNQPYRHRLIHWGTQLHDRFMLPQVLEDDFSDIIQQLKQAGFAASMDFFKPHFAFRFPFLGETVYRGITMELRQALEPWHVLGEEPGGGGTVRFVDSSVERVQVKVSGVEDKRHIVTCNGRRVPMIRCSEQGTYIGGVRYRAWQPPQCLHPTIGVHTPLVFDLYDTWTGRAVAGCTYHVGHPGGRNYDTFPVNSYEAEGRRISRFINGGYTTGTGTAIPAVEKNSLFPYTLDLRYQTE